MLALRLTVLLAVVAGHEPNPITVRRLTLRDAMALAFDRSLALARARVELPEAKANRRLFRSAVLPRLSVNGNLVRNSSEVSFGPPDDVRTILPLVSWDVRVNVSQPIFAYLKAYRPSKIGNRHRLRRGAGNLGSGAGRREPAVPSRARGGGAHRAGPARAPTGPSGAWSSAGRRWTLLLTLIGTPVAYSIFDDWSGGLARVRGGSVRRSSEPSIAAGAEGRSYRV